MQRSSAKRRIGSHAPTAAILLSQSLKAVEHSRSGLHLVLFMRLTAVLWIVEGLGQWAVVLSNTSDGLSPVTTLPIAKTVAMVFFAVIDLVASVGLWLAAPWGGVIWLVSAGAQLLVAVVMPAFFDHPWLTALADLVLVSLYMVLTWQVAVATQQPSA